MTDRNDEDACEGEGCGHSRAYHSKGTCQGQMAAGGGGGGPHAGNWDDCECTAFQEAAERDPEPPGEPDTY